MRKLRELIALAIPPDQWRFPVLILMGILFGLGLVILKISNAVSYLSDDPATCVNCHVMAPQFATWQHGSHARVAVCNDCHVPHDNIIRKYFFKAQDGLRHATMFTLRMEPQVIQIKEAGAAVVQENCQRCHKNLTERVSAGRTSYAESRHGEGLLCWQCHRETPHGRVNSLASTPYARVPRLAKVMPDWMESFLKNPQKTNLDTTLHP